MLVTVAALQRSAYASSRDARADNRAARHPRFVESRPLSPSTIDRPDFACRNGLLRLGQLSVRRFELREVVKVAGATATPLQRD